LGNLIGNTWEVLKCGAGERWRRSDGLIVWEVKRYYKSLGVEKYPAHNKKD